AWICFFVDGTAVTLEAGDTGFAQVAGELRAQRIEVAVEEGDERMKLTRLDLSGRPLREVFGTNTKDIVGFLHRPDVQLSAHGIAAQLKHAGQSIHHRLSGKKHAGPVGGDGGLLAAKNRIVLEEIEESGAWEKSKILAYGPFGRCNVQWSDRRSC